MILRTSRIFNWGLFMLALFSCNNTPPQTLLLDNLKVCPHRFGKRMTYTDQTDCLCLGFSYEPYMTLAKQYNIKVGAFISIYDFNDSRFIIAEKDYHDGDLWIDEYSMCNELENKIINNEL